MLGLIKMQNSSYTKHYGVWIVWLMTILFSSVAYANETPVTVSTETAFVDTAKIKQSYD